MRFPDDFQRAELIKRYKRFLADVRLPSGEVVTVHCPNTGAMTGCAEPGATVWLQPAANRKAKYAWGWRYVETAQGLANIYSAGANTLFEQAFNAGRLLPFEGYRNLVREVPYADGLSRADALLSGHPTRRNCLVEIKSVTLYGENGLGFFPDAKSERGVKHIAHLRQAMQKDDVEAALVYVIQHQGIQRVAPARHIHAAYADALAEAQQQGLHVITLKAELEGGIYRI